MGWWYVYGGRGWRGNGFTTQRGGNIAPEYLGQVAAELGSGHYTTNPRSPLRPWCGCVVCSGEGICRGKANRRQAAAAASAKKS